MWHPEADQQSHPLHRLIDLYLCSGFFQDDLLPEKLHYVPEYCHYYVTFLIVKFQLLVITGNIAEKPECAFPLFALFYPNLKCLKPLAPLYTSLRVFLSLC